MNKNLYLVEGKTDIARLKFEGAKYVVQTRGYNLSLQTINFLKLAQEKRKIILLFDPDQSGKMTAKMIASILTNCTIVNLNKQMCIGCGKIGIAESDNKYLKKILLPYLREDSNAKEKESITYQELIELGLVGNNAKELRKIIKDKFFVNVTNGKTLLRDLNILRLNKKLIEDTLNGR